MADARHTPINRYTFGPLVVAVQGLGVYFGGEHLTRNCDALTLDELRVANREAWKQKRAAGRAAERVSNASVHGCTPHDRACQHFDVADRVIRETWKRITSGGGHV
jgi:hypothetical protein